MATPAEQIQQTGENTAAAQSEYARGQAFMARYLAEQDAAKQEAFLESIGVQGDPGGGDQGAAAVLAGLGGLAGASTGAQGSAYSQYAGAAPGLYQRQLSLARVPFEQQLTLGRGQLAINQQELANQASQFQQELALDRQRLAQQSAAAAADLDLARQEAALTDPSGLDFDDQLALARFEHQVQEDELDRAFALAQFEEEQLKEQRDARTTAFETNLMLKVLSGEPITEGDIETLMGLYSGGGSGDVGGLIDVVGGQQEAAAEAAKDRRENRQEYRTNITSSIASAFDGAATGKGLSRRDLMNAVYGAIAAEFKNENGNFGFGVKDPWVRGKVRSYVNSQYKSYLAGLKPDKKEPKKDRVKLNDITGGIGSAFNNYIDSLDVPDSGPLAGERPKPSYKTAFSRIYGTLRTKYGTPKPRRWRGGVRDRLVRNAIHSFLRSQGLRRPTRGFRGGPGPGR